MDIGKSLLEALNINVCPSIGIKNSKEMNREENIYYINKVEK